MRNILLLLSYDGKGFSGFQLQKRRVSIQGVLQECLRELTGEEARVVSSGRTDAGVHAVSQVVNFATSSRLGPDAILRALNSRLPPSIRVRESREVSPEFNARKGAARKIYSYVIHNDSILPPFYDGYVWHLPGPRIDVVRLSRIGAQLEGEHDFRAFMGSGSQITNTIRRIENAGVARSGEFVIITFVGNGFLKNMVRNMVGTVVDFYRGKGKKESIGEVIRSKDRKQAGRCAPGCGLYLLGVDYPGVSFRGELPFILDLRRDVY